MFSGIKIISRENYKQIQLAIAGHAIDIQYLMREIIHCDSSISSGRCYNASNFAQLPCTKTAHSSGATGTALLST